MIYEKDDDVFLHFIDDMAAFPKHTKDSINDFIDVGLSSSEANKHQDSIISSKILQLWNFFT